MLSNCIPLTVCGNLVVSTKRLVLWRSEIFGGISNEISVILDQSTLLKDMRGILFCSGSPVNFCLICDLQQKGTLLLWREIQMLWLIWETQRTIGRHSREQWGLVSLFLWQKMEPSSGYVSSRFFTSR